MVVAQTPDYRKWKSGFSFLFNICSDTILRIKMKGDPAMAVNSFTGRYDPNEPPHMANSSDAFLVEMRDRKEWDAPQCHFADWVEAHAQGGLMPLAAPIEEMAPYLGNMHKLAVVNGGSDFAYRIYGERIKDAANIDLQSKTVSGLIEPARSAFLAHYRDLLNSPRLFVGSVRYAGLIRAHPIWFRCTAPAGSGSVEGFFVLTYPSDDLTSS